MDFEIIVSTALHFHFERLFHGNWLNLLECFDFKQSSIQTSSGTLLSGTIQEYEIV